MFSEPENNVKCLQRMPIAIVILKNWKNRKEGGRGGEEVGQSPDRKKNVDYQQM